MPIMALQEVWEPPGLHHTSIFREYLHIAKGYFNWLKMRWLLLLSSLAFGFFIVHPALSVPTRRATGPTRVLDTDFPDPCLLEDGGKYYAFGTSGNGVDIQLATSSDLNHWELQKGQDMLAKPLPKWINQGSPNTWAPDVKRRPDGKYVMFFAAVPASNASVHCLGTAISSSPRGPYRASDTSFACPQSDGGAIDATQYTDGNTLYVAYKIDGNAKYGGGYAPSTPILLQEVKSDGVTPVGQPMQILDKDEGDGPLIEAPSIVKHGSTYFLFFSSGLFNTLAYDVSYATAPSIKGPYTKAHKPNAPLFQTGDQSNTGPLHAPGGGDISPDGTKMLFHAFKSGTTVNGGRATFLTDIRLNANIATHP